jgi:uncharacterized protein YciI
MMEKKQFFLKLIPPRPTFVHDMTEDEKKIMQEHAVYWKDLMEKGIVVVFGPVLDPNGAFGMGIAEVNDENMLREMQANDPSTKSGLNKLEYYPMFATIKKD